MERGVKTGSVSENLPAIRKAVGEIQTWGAADVTKYLTDRREAIHNLLKEGVDFGLIPGTDKLAIFKPGIQKLGRFAHFFGMPPVYPKYETVLDEADNFKEWSYKVWDKKNKVWAPKQTRGFYRFRVRCTLFALGTDEIAGSREGECCSIERGREQSSSNTVWQMAAKRAESQAITEYTCTSDILTDEEAISESQKRGSAGSPPPKKANGDVFVFKFGKYKDKPITDPEVEDGYLQWLLDNPDKKYPETTKAAQAELKRREGGDTPKPEAGQEQAGETPAGATGEAESANSEDSRDRLISEILGLENKLLEIDEAFKPMEVRKGFAGDSDLRKAPIDGLNKLKANLEAAIKQPGT